MKKLLAIICVLLVILVGMYLYKTNLLKSNITAQEVEKIEEYISKYNECKPGFIKMSTSHTNTGIIQINILQQE